MQPFILPDAFSEDECDRIVTAARAAGSADARLVGGDTAHRIRRAELVWTDALPELGWASARLVDLVREANRSLGFDLTEMLESPQSARYGAERAGHFDWHTDIGAGPVAARRKLTLVVQLSDPAAYGGGALELQPSSIVTEAPRARGTAIAFPSFVLHRVTPVTEGERFSLSFWVHGPAFR